MFVTGLPRVKKVSTDTRHSEASGHVKGLLYLLNLHVNSLKIINRAVSSTGDPFEKSFLQALLVCDYLPASDW